ncbi:MAG TPA: hypothetical protein VE090_06100 [Methylomirabilota bacterium]|nr:hypothetical protein [Methylomirabilota bacterium]
MANKNKKQISNAEKPDRRLMLAILLAVFGLLLFIALALTLPFNN